MSNKLRGQWSVCISLLSFLSLSAALCAQNVDRGRNEAASPVRNRAPELSELAKDNLNRVAASSVQIREVLVRDTGLLVELKRWVAKEAADNGQVVEDSNLSDQAIFDRLDHDVQFRSIATRLLQRYGYLLPATNPDSSFGKEEEYILKERARRLVQIESQEDSESGAPEKSNQKQRLERTTVCNPQDQDSTCEKPAQRRRPPDREIENEQQPVPDMEPRSTPDLPRTLKTDYLDDGLSPLDVPSIQQGGGFSSASLKSQDGIPFSPQSVPRFQED